MNVQDLTQQIVALTQSRQYAEAVALWRRHRNALQDSELALRMVAAAMAQSGDLASAELILGELILKADVPAATYALAGRIAFDLSKFEESANRWERAVRLNENSTGWWRWFADAAIRAMVPERALRAASTHRLRINQDAELAITYATLLVGAGRSDEALIEFERILASWPHHPEAGPAYVEFVLREYPLEARSLLGRVRWRPSLAVLSPGLVRASVRIPAFVESNESARWWRIRLVDELRMLTELARNSTLSGNLRAQCLASTPFFAAYTENDVTDIQLAWGDFVEALVAPLREDFRPLRSRKPGVPLTVGVVSNRFTDSSAGRFFNPWLEGLRAAGFTVHLYALGNRDATTDQLASRFILHHAPSDDVDSWQLLAQRIFEDCNDVLLFPEPQGSQLTQLLAGIRLAPVQCAAFGNPLTTGLKTMDIFLVPDESEVDQPASQYREQVVRIAGLGITPAGAPNAALFSRASFGFAEDEHIYLAAQQLQKWTPDFIDAVIQILAADSRGKLVYFALDWGLSTRAFELMLRNKFNLAGLDYGARVAVVGQLSRDNYFALLQAVDVSLDTFGFSGGSTTLDAAAIGLAVVNLKGNFLRGRQSAAILERAGQRCNVVTDVGAFVARAIAITKAKRLSTTQDSKLSPPTGVTRRNEAQVYESFADYLMREIVGRHDLFAIAGAP